VDRFYVEEIGEGLWGWIAKRLGICFQERGGASLGVFFGVAVAVAVVGVKVNVDLAIAELAHFARSPSPNAAGRRACNRVERSASNRSDRLLEEGDDWVEARAPIVNDVVGLDPKLRRAKAKRNFEVVETR